MRPKKGKVLPKKGKVLHQAGQDDDSVVNYVSAIAGALQEELGTTHQGINLAMRWTGASERTVKYWFAGTSGPNGERLYRGYTPQAPVLVGLRAGRSLLRGRSSQGALPGQGRRRSGFRSHQCGLAERLS